MLVEVYGHTLEEKIFEEFNQIRDVWKDCVIKNVGQMMGQISYRQAKKPCKSRLFPVDLDAPYRARTCDP